MAQGFQVHGRDDGKGGKGGFMKQEDQREMWAVERGWREDGSREDKLAGRQVKEKARWMKQVEDNKKVKFGMRGGRAGRIKPGGLIDL